MRPALLYGRAVLHDVERLALLDLRRRLVEQRVGPAADRRREHTAAVARMAAAAGVA